MKVGKPKKAEVFFLWKRLLLSFIVIVDLQFTRQCQYVDECIMSYPDCNCSIFRVPIPFSRARAAALLLNERKHIHFVSSLQKHKLHKEWFV